MQFLLANVCSVSQYGIHENITSTMHDIIDGTNTLSTTETEELYFSYGDIKITLCIQKNSRGGPWIFMLTEDFTLKTDCTGITFRSD